MTYFSLSNITYWYPEGIDYVREVLSNAEIKVAKKKTRKKPGVSYYNVPMAFDIETSNFRQHVDDENSVENKNGGRKFCTMYVWQFGINGRVIMGRTWEEFEQLMDVISEYTTIETRALIYIHNLSFEFGFIQYRFQWDTLFCKAAHDPYYAVTVDGIEFRDSLVLTALSLEKSADNLTKYKVQKMVGDLDYEKVRGTKTPLTDKEIGYCTHDVLTLNAIIQEKIEEEGTKGIAGIPLTNTGYVRRELRKLCYPTDDKSAASRYHSLMKDLTMTVEDYKQYKRAFAGGFTHANAYYVGKHIKGKIDSIDFTSSYPAVMLSERYPMTAPEIKDTLSRQEFIDIIKDKYRCMIFDVTFKNIRKKVDVFETPISYSKCKAMKEGTYTLNNGRVARAEKLTTTITDVDFTYINKFYDYDSLAIGETRIFKAAYLPKPIIEGILTFYKDKTTLKGIPEKAAEYQRKKGMLNSTYGCTVTDPLNPEIDFEDGEWSIEDPKTSEPLMDKLIGQYNRSQTRFLYYPWGIFITSYARRNLFTGIYELGKDYIYSDTDSNKFLNYDKHKDYIENYNKAITKKIARVLKFYGIDPSEAAPKTIKGVSKPLGVWDVETEGHPYTEFKTLGAKRYMYTQDGEIHITIAGLSKTMGKKAIVNNGKMNPYDFFNDDMEIDADHSGRLTHTYIDQPMDGTLTDYLGNKMEFHELSGVNLEKGEFNLSMDDGFIKYCIDMMDLLMV